MLSLSRLVPKLTHISRAKFSRQLATSVMGPPANDGKEPLKPPIKFTESQAYLDYKARANFYGENNDRDLPDSHNLVLTTTGILAIFYLIFLRDDIESDGDNALFQPLHETVPELAIPIIQAAIVENKRFGNDTKKLEMKLAELMKEPEKHGISRPKLIEN